jgi:hypothetical protein
MDIIKKKDIVSVSNTPSCWIDKRLFNQYKFMIKKRNSEKNWKPSTLKKKFITFHIH